MARNLRIEREGGVYSVIHREDLRLRNRADGPIDLGPYEGNYIDFTTTHPDLDDDENDGLEESVTRRVTREAVGFVEVFFRPVSDAILFSRNDPCGENEKYPSRASFSSF